MGEYSNYESASYAINTSSITDFEADKITIFMSSIQDASEYSYGWITATINSEIGKATVINQGSLTPGYNTIPINASENVIDLLIFSSDNIMINYMKFEKVSGTYNWDGMVYPSSLTN